jgi:CTP:phosphocholine cytidylyltransferase-like protein|tara:strand:+ start:959 stop:1147 length:189 start_codon:yes stop_codon:yes gene_type:complete
MSIYVIIGLIIVKICVGFLGFKFYKLEKKFDKLVKDNEKYKRELEVRRNIGMDSLWKAIRGF